MAAGRSVDQAIGVEGVHSGSIAVGPDRGNEFLGSVVAERTIRAWLIFQVDQRLADLFTRRQGLRRPPGAQRGGSHYHCDRPAVTGQRHLVAGFDAIEYLGQVRPRVGDVVGGHVQDCTPLYRAWILIVTVRLLH